jgi:F0F1-type ATP synthase assembly protein I
MTIGQVGTEMVAPIAVGWVVDYVLNTLPLFMVIGAILGLIGGVYHLIVLNRPGRL